ncbi:hypothetical protein T492DRAFT_890745, partial [Pavlovales sp. CCMP2436]
MARGRRGGRRRSADGDGGEEEDDELGDGLALSPHSFPEGRFEPRSPAPRTSQPPQPLAPSEPRPELPELPGECISMIVAHLTSATDLVAVQRLGTDWQRCGADEEPWRKLCVELWPVCSYESLSASET